MILIETIGKTKPNFSNTDAIIYHLDNPSQDWSEFLPEHHHPYKENWLQEKIINSMGERQILNFQYQGHVYLNKTYVYIHKEVDADKDILSFTRNKHRNNLYLFGNNYLEKNFWSILQEGHGIEHKISSPTNSFSISCYLWQQIRIWLAPN